MLWLRSVSTGVSAICFASLLLSCSGGGDDADLHVNFGMNGSGTCDEVVVDVDLAGAFAVVVHHGHVDSPILECAASALLDKDCDIEFSEPDSGRILRATISGCRIGAFTGLFGCGFSEGDVSLLQTRSTAICSCATPGCDQTPAVCASTSDSPYYCEDCTNGVDDDGDRLVDCIDPSCDHAYACGPVPTSSTTTVPSTTVTTLPPVSGFTLTFGLANASNVGSLKWDTWYGDSLSRKRSAATDPECTTLVPGAVGLYDDDPDTQTLHASVSGLSGEAGPLAIAECTFEADTVPAAEDFTVVVVEARDTDENLIASPPPVEINDIIGVTTSTLETNTTTTTTNTTTTLILGDTIAVVFHLDSASDALGALQLRIDYSDAPGVFVGSGATVSCTNKVNATQFAANDVDALHELNLGLISLSGFSAPTDLVECVFRGDLADPPVPGDFPVQIVDATDPDGALVTASVSVRLRPGD